VAPTLNEITNERMILTRGKARIPFATKLWQEAQRLCALLQPPNHSLQELTSTLRAIKNLVIGNVTNKAMFLHHDILQRLATVLSRPEVQAENAWTLLESVVVIVGSLTRLRAENAEDYVPAIQNVSATLQDSHSTASLWLRSLWLARLPDSDDTVLSRLSAQIQNVLLRVVRSVDPAARHFLVEACCRTLALLAQHSVALQSQCPTPDVGSAVTRAMTIDDDVARVLVDILTTVDSGSATRRGMQLLTWIARLLTNRYLLAIHTHRLEGTHPTWQLTAQHVNVLHSLLTSPLCPLVTQYAVLQLLSLLTYQHPPTCEVLLKSRMLPWLLAVVTNRHQHFPQSLTATTHSQPLVRPSLFSAAESPLPVPTLRACVRLYACKCVANVAAQLSLGAQHVEWCTLTVQHALTLLEDCFSASTNAATLLQLTRDDPFVVFLLPHILAQTLRSDRQVLAWATTHDNVLSRSAVIALRLHVLFVLLPSATAASCTSLSPPLSPSARTHNAVTPLDSLNLSSSSSSLTLSSPIPLSPTRMMVSSSLQPPVASVSSVARCDENSPLATSVLQCLIHILELLEVGLQQLTGHALPASTEAMEIETTNVSDMSTSPSLSGSVATVTSQSQGPLLSTSQLTTSLLALLSQLLTYHHHALRAGDSLSPRRDTLQRLVTATLRCAVALSRLKMTGALAASDPLRSDLLPSLEPKPQPLASCLLNFLRSSSQSPATMRLALTALCNLVLDSQPMRYLLVEDATCLKALVDWSCQSADTELQTLALWTLKNLTYRAEVSVKQTLMRTLSYTTWCKVTLTPSTAVRVQAWTLVRNLVHTLSPTQYVGDWSVKSLCSHLAQQLQEALDNPNCEVCVQVLYVYANLLAVLPTELLESLDVHPAATLARVVPLLTHANATPSLQIAALWVIINATAESTRTQRLPEDKFGLVEWLTRVSQRPNIDLDLHDRVLTVLNIFRPKISAVIDDNNSHSAQSKPPSSPPAPADTKSS